MDDSEKPRLYTQISVRNIVGYTMLTHDDNAHASHIEAEVCMTVCNPTQMKIHKFSPQQSTQQKVNVVQKGRDLICWEADSWFLQQKEEGGGEKNKPKTAWANVGR
jgi:hypothetical protein